MREKETLPVIYITEDLAATTADLLDSFARRRPSEGVVYWLGLAFGDRSVVTTLVVPNAKTTGGSISTTAEANAEAVSLMVGTPLVHLGQAHSHPGRLIDHSPIDDRETFACVDGAISVVVPWFGRYGLRLQECGIHRHIEGKFQRVRDSEKHLKLIPGIVDLRPPSVKGGS